MRSRRTRTAADATTKGVVSTVSSRALEVRGNQILNADGQPVVLRGFGLGGWMNMENFITGYPANEQAQRDAIRGVIGDELYLLFFDRFLEYFFTHADAAFVRSLGLNLVRLPINYRHFEDDMRPFELKEEGFKHLDRAIDACARHGVYTILDLHARGISAEDIDTLMRSFLFENCRQRTELAQTLASYA